MSAFKSTDSSNDNSISDVYDPACPAAIDKGISRLFSLGSALFLLLTGACAGYVYALRDDAFVTRTVVVEQVPLVQAEQEEQEEQKGQEEAQNVVVGLKQDVLMPEIEPPVKENVKQKDFSDFAAHKENQWIINASASTLSFEAVQYGQAFNGSFDFDGEILFDPENLDKSAALIEIDLASIVTGSLERDTQACSEKWFDTERYPKAVYEALEIVAGEEEGTYIAHGTLSLHGVELPLDLPFSLRFYNEGGQEELAKNSVEMLAQASLSRAGFGVGVGDEKGNEAVGDNVDVFIVLYARKAQP